MTEWLPKRILHQETMTIDLHSEGGVQQEDSQLLEYTPQGLAILDKFEDQRSLDVTQPDKNSLDEDKGQVQVMHKFNEMASLVDSGGADILSGGEHN